MSCPTPFEAMARRTEEFLDELRLIPSPKPVLTPMINRGEFPQGVGTVMTTFTIGQSLPVTDLPEFLPVTTSTTADNCATTWNDVDVGFFEKTFRPEVFGWRGPVICQDNLIYDWNRDRFLDAYMRAMRKNVDWTIENRYGAIYDHYIPKAVAAETLSWSDVGTGFPGQTPTLPTTHTYCQLDQGMLDQTAQTLLEAGATEGPFTDGWINWSANGPIFTLEIGMEMSQNLLRINSELRQDYRWAEATKGEEGSSIIRRLAAAKTIGNFKHLVTLTPPRYNWNGAGYTRVNTWVEDTTTTTGFATKLNPEWLSADYEGARVLHPDVFKDLIIRPVNVAGGDTRWPYKSYMGEWKFVTGGYRIQAEDCLDPLEKYGRHFAEFKHAAEPIRPEYGRLIIYRRCTNTAECITCAPGAS